MQKSNYILSVKASEDISGIAKFTIENFGVQQANIYRQSLISTFNQLGKTPEIGREYIAIKEQMLSRYRFKAHTIFYYPIDKKVIVVRILGNKMSFLNHL